VGRGTGPVSAAYPLPKATAGYGDNASRKPERVLPACYN